MFLWVGAQNKTVHVKVCGHQIVFVFKAINKVFRTMKSWSFFATLWSRMAQVQGWQLFGSGCGFGPVDGHHVAKVASDGPPHLALVHDLFLRTYLWNKRKSARKLPLTTRLYPHKISFHSRNYLLTFWAHVVVVHAYFSLKNYSKSLHFVQKIDAKLTFLNSQLLDWFGMNIQNNLLSLFLHILKVQVFCQNLLFGQKLDL